MGVNAARVNLTGLQENRVHIVLEDSQGRTWIGAEADTAQWSDVELRVQPLSRDFPVWAGTIFRFSLMLDKRWLEERSKAGSFTKSNSSPEQVALIVYNVIGQNIAALFDEKEADRHRVEWNGRNELGSDAGSGVYFESHRCGYVCQRQGTSARAGMNERGIVGIIWP